MWLVSRRFGLLCAYFQALFPEAATYIVGAFASVLGASRCVQLFGFRRDLLFWGGPVVCVRERERVTDVRHSHEAAEAS